MAKNRKLFFNRKAVKKKWKISVVRTDLKQFKAVGASKLKHRLNKRFKGVSKPQLQNILSRSKANQKLNTQFANKAITYSICAQAVQIRL